MCDFNLLARCLSFAAFLVLIATSTQAQTNGIPSQKIEPAERQRVVAAAAALLKAHYVYPEAGRKMADALLTHQKDGDDAGAVDGQAIADLLTRRLREMSGDMHLGVVYSRDKLPPQPPAPAGQAEAGQSAPAGPPPAFMARYKREMEQQNCTFEKVRILPPNIGYVKLNAFPDPLVCGAKAMAAMDTIDHADAAIFDLRDNRGGDSAMVSLIASYLFDHPEYLYDPRERPVLHSWTHSPVSGSNLADKPVYVLTSGSTISAGEQFTYDLKMLRRVIVVGETTHGSAHAGVWHRIDDHFGIGIPEVQSVNPYSKADWEGVGIEPDVKVKSEDALGTAVKLAQARISAR